MTQQVMPVVYDFTYSPETRWKGTENIKYYQFDIVTIQGTKLSYLSRESSKFRKNFTSVSNGEKWAQKKIEELIAAAGDGTAVTETTTP